MPWMRTMTWMRWTTAVLALVMGAAVAEETGMTGAHVLKHKMENIEGEEVALSKYEGKVLMLVNVASRCGLTPQYEALTELHERYHEQGLVIIGVPANNFGAQEPGTNQEILEFCTTNFGVEFPMMAKVSVKGDDICPLYKDLVSEDTNEPFAGEIAWNFTKFLVGRDGHVVGRFEPRTAPDDETVIAAIESALEAAAPASSEG
jgi:glutathione peroxidase